MHHPESGHTHHAHTDHNSPGRTSQKEGRENLRLALSATLHCLLGCGLGEVFGMAISVWLGLEMWPSMTLAIVLGFVFGMAFGVIPLLRKQFTLKMALKTVFLAEGLSIAVMEFFEVFVQVKIPGVMEAGLSDPVFWLGMLAGLAAGFLAALPVNYVMIKRGVRHQH